MNTDTSKSTKSSEWDRLERLLRDYLLSSERSHMSHSIRSILKAYFAGRTVVKVHGREGITLSRVVKVLDQFGVRAEVEVQKDAKSIHTKPFQTFADLNATRIWIPYGSARFLDFEVLVPFSIEKAVHDLSHRELPIPTPDVLSLYLIYLRVVTGLPWHYEVENRIIDDVIDSQKTGVLSPALQPNDSIVKSMHRHLMGMPSKALLYIGCDPGDGSCAKLRRIANDPLSTELNVVTRSMGLIAQPTSLSLRDVTHLKASGRSPAEELSKLAKKEEAHGVHYPTVMKAVKFSLDQIATVERNLSSIELILHSVEGAKVGVTGSRQTEDSIDDRVMRCLKWRMACKTEESIRDKLEFDDWSEYQVWLRENCIDIEPRYSGSAYERWLEAARELGVDQPIDTDSAESRPVAEAGDSVQTSSLSTDQVDKGGRHASIKNMGDYWIVKEDKEEVHMKHLEGFRELVYLLQRPGKNTSIHDLSLAVRSDAILGSLSENLGKTSRSEKDKMGLTEASLSDHIEDTIDGRLNKSPFADIEGARDTLQAQIESGELSGDELIQARDKLNKLIQYLKANKDHRGRLRKDNPTSEKARLATRKRIERVVKRVAEKLPALGKHLGCWITYGKAPGYKPPDSDIIIWDLQSLHKNR